MKSILLIGGSGFLGTATLEAFNLNKLNFEYSTKNRSSKKNHITIDLNDPKSLLNKLNLLKPYDVIVLIASKVGWGNDEDLFNPNLLSVAIICSFAKIWKSKIIFASAALIHGSKETLITSRSPLKPDNEYLKSKLLAEELIIASQVDHCILRIGGIFGLNGPAHLSLNKSIKNAIEGRSLENKIKNRPKRNYIYVHDVANLIIKVIEKDITGIHLIASTEVLTINEILLHLSNLFNVKFKDSKKNLLLSDQVISPSSIVKTRSFKDCLKDIKERTK